MKKIMVLFTGMILAVSATGIAAKSFDGLQFPDTVKLSGSDTILQLNGVGYRTKFVFDVYAGALYTTKKVTSRDSVQALKGPNRIHMHFVYSEVDSEKLVDAWNEGFEENNSDDTLKTLESRIHKFNAMFPTVKEGDEVLLDYVPGTGTTVTIKGEVKGVIEGADFNAALLDIWLGEEPADDDLKDAMLGETDD